MPGPRLGAISGIGPHSQPNRVLTLRSQIVPHYAPEGMPNDGSVTNSFLIALARWWFDGSVPRREAERWDAQQSVRMIIACRSLFSPEYSLFGVRSGWSKNGGIQMVLINANFTRNWNWCGLDASEGRHNFQPISDDHQLRAAEISQWCTCSRQWSACTVGLIRCIGIISKLNINQCIYTW